MNDELDVYLGRSMKKWAAERNPPVGSRGRLLSAAASLPVQQQEQRLSKTLLLILLYVVKESFFSTPDHVYAYYCDEWPRTPNILSSAWYSRVTFNWRSVT